jgi:hypothetical protein
MIECLALLHVAEGSSILHNITTKYMNEKMKEATELTINLHQGMDTKGIPKSLLIKHNAIGQCLRSMLDILENDNERNNKAPA